MELHWTFIVISSEVWKVRKVSNRLEGTANFLLYLLLDCKVKNVEDRAAFTSYEVLAGGVRVGGIDALEARRNIVSVLVSLLRLVSLIPPARNNF